VSWYAVDGEGLDLATGRPPRPPGNPSPLSALAAAPVVSWPLSVVDDDGGRLSLAQVLGPGGDAVEALLDALAGAGEEVDFGALAAATPAGTVALPLAVVAPDEAVHASARVDAAWLAEVDRRRHACRHAVVSAGRSDALEAALHVGVLLGVDRLGPAAVAGVAGVAGVADTDAHVASGARLWLLAGAVASALAGADPDPFAPWGALVTAGWWPVGPSDGRLVVSR
jgi:hypothetical protein